MIALNIKFSNKCCLEKKMSRQKNQSRKKKCQKINGDQTHKNSVIWNL